ncbi:MULTISPECIES: class I SAM-dependent DNA methyltransferase [unclassified Amycolatopsis]|uniref:class I SAM-dependent DNA methyltransferase n=1 Tax=unclassified Amycolatopsis TaxID=2618356 RepID=UPI002E1C62E0|nr:MULTISPECIES: methyltransferase domain-containing protein [unclassified Amycolatopsis]
MTAAAYDAMAVRYAEFAREVWDASPLDNAALAAFVEHVRGAGLVADLGCGPGHLTAHLRDRGLDVFGVDLSPAMIELARAAAPDLRFEVGSMAALDLPDASLAGILTWYSMIHSPPEEVPGYFAEFTRTLAAGGHVLLGCFESDGDPLTVFDHAVTPAYRWPLDELAGLARDAGLVEMGRVYRVPGEGERFRRAALLLRKP